MTKSSGVRVTGTLKGPNRARIFRFGEDPVEGARDSNLCELLQAPARALGADA
jgi:hypothetical protein